MRKILAISFTAILLVCITILGSFLYFNYKKIESLSSSLTNDNLVSESQSPVTTSINNSNQGENMPKEITLTINDQKLILNLEDNIATRALIAKLQDGPISVNAHDYGEFEKVGTLGFELPTDDHQLTTTPGDVMLYQGNQITIFYGENSWSYTPIGHLKNFSSSNLKSLLGDGNASLELSL